ncbi:translational activator of GCN4 [Rhizophlyctis rosea]|uniref:eIF-2-alpha kinase activator GCN1 n=1 Tax=Rhizophlyctis rosea TaxID=64517 RepID=A0AAD5SC42_9FUNG|nr:translational activator of GCN4 [Rhizophlyctis rosea]
MAPQKGDLHHSDTEDEDALQPLGSNENIADDLDETQFGGLSASLLELPWPEFVKTVIIPGVPVTSVVKRTAVLHGLSSKLKREELPDTLIPIIFETLLHTVPRYTDISSRKSVLSALSALYNASATKSKGDAVDSPFMRVASKLLERELKGNLSSLAPSVILVYTSWTARLITLALSSSSSSTTLDNSIPFKTTLSLHVSLLDALAVSSGTRSSHMLKRSIMATTVAVKAGGKDNAGQLLNSLLTPNAVEGKDGWKNALMIGIVVRVATTLGAKEAVDGQRDSIIKFYTKAILGSRLPVPTAHLQAFDVFAQGYVTSDVLVKEIVAPGERLLLRSPEVVIKVFDFTFKSASFDLSKVFREKFADALLNHLKSTNESVRTDAFSLFKTLAARSSDEAELVKVVEIIVKGFAGKSPSVDHRQQYYACISSLAALPPVSKKIIDSVPALAGKEANEIVLHHCLQSLIPHIKAYLSSSSPDAATVSNLVRFILTGVSDAKSGTRKAYLFALVGAFTSEVLSAVGDVSKLVDAMVKVVDKVQSAGVGLLDPKKETPALVEGVLGLRWILEVVEWAKAEGKSAVAEQIEKTNVIAKILTPAPPKSFLLNEKLYTKLLPTADEQLPFLQTIIAIIKNDEYYNITGASDSAKDKQPLASALTWTLVNAAQPVSREAYSLVSKLTSSSASLLSKTIKLVRIGLGALLVEHAKELAAAKPEILAWGDRPPRSSKEFGVKVFQALQSAVPYVPEDEEAEQDANIAETLQKSLLDLAVLSCHPVVIETMGEDVWVRLCFRAGTGPQSIVESTWGEKWLRQRIEGSGEDVSDGGIAVSVPAEFRKATLSAITLFTEVATDVVLPIVLPWSLSTLQSDEAKALTPIDVAVFNTPEGELHNDPTVKKGAGRVDDRPKTAEEKWERELKKELEAKQKAAGAKGGKGPQGKGEKLTKAEIEARQAQVVKEAEIRKRVAGVRERLLNALDGFDAVVKGIRRSVGEDAQESFGDWMGKVVEAVLHGVVRREVVVWRDGKKGDVGPVLCGRTAVDSFVGVGQVAGEQIEDIVDDVAAGVLRAQGVVEGGEGLDECVASTPVQAQIFSLLSSLPELYSSSEPLPPPTFTYLFPLLRFIILREGRIASLKDRVITELVMSASDILLAHCGIAASRILPRRDMVKCLVEMLEKYPRLRNPAKEGLLTLAINVGEGELDEEDEEDELHINGDGGKKETDLPLVVGELLNGLLSLESAVRESCLLALGHLTIPEDVEADFQSRLWIARFDPEEGVRNEAVRLWEEFNGEDVLENDNVGRVLELVTHKVSAVRLSAGRGLCAALQEYDDLVTPTIETLFETYREKAIPPEPEYDDYGMVIPESLNKPDPWEARAGVASALQASVPVLTDLAPLRSLFNFLIEREALGDRNDHVQKAMLDAGLAAINANGKPYVRDLLSVFDDYLSRPAKASGTHDTIREACVILLGTLAQHLDATDPMIPEVIGKLVETLKTPSEAVQVAVAECLPALIKVNRAGAAPLVEKLLYQLTNSPKYGERRGAAYGLAGVVKGCGIGSLKDMGVMTSLKNAVEDKKKVEKREGAVFAFETLSQTLGRLFEPYVIQILPLLLVCFGDSSREVREATEDACRVIMSKLSGHCVKLVMPTLLNGLEDKNWRAKTGSIEVLASMAYLAPKQLSVSLPTVVPRLCDVLADSHQKVQEAAKQALTQFGGVIKNPEIQELVPTLLLALVDPNTKTHPALIALLDTSFVHYIDAPSLALLVPILQRGLGERSAEVKKKAAQIVGNMASLTDHKDLIPYLPSLMPGVKEVLVDPVPEARAIAAKALGTLMEKLGEDNFPGLVPELLQTLKSDTSGVDRSGAAQGLSEVVAGLGLERLEGLLPEVVANASSNKVYVREGFMTLLIYLPATHGEKFTPYLGQIIPPILRGLADESESVREASLKSGQMIVRNYATKAVDLLLPELETGLFDENWRIRASSVQLMGDLLYRIAGVSGKVEMEGEEDEGTLGTETGRQALVNALGKLRYEKVLASLYIVRGDSSAIVRQSSLHVWEAIVNNTPRTLKEILPVMMEILIDNLASESSERRGVAARTVGDLVRKLGDAILGDIVPILERGLESDNAGTRQGVCVGMSEIMASAGKTQVGDFVVHCVPLVRTALVDSEAEVREAAAQAFDMVHQNLGSKAIDEVLPSLLNELKAGTDGSAASGYALEALKEIMAVRSNIVFPVLIPTLISRPISSFNARALGSLITVAGQALNRRLGTILPALMDGLEQDDGAVPDIQDALKTLLVNVEGDDGVHQLMLLLAESADEGTKQRKRAGCEAMKWFCEGTRETIAVDYLAEWVERLVELMRGGDKAVVVAAHGALEAVVKKVRKEDLDRFVGVVRRGIRDVEAEMSEDEIIEGFCLPKGISPFLPIFSQGLMYGGADIKEQSALGFGDLVRRISPEALRPFVTLITGPLIRVIGDRSTPGVKSAILQTLGLLLVKVPAMLKPFLPQLQRTFVKSLSEPSSAMVRDRAARCLTALIALQTRLDPLVVELAQGIRGAEDRGVKEAMWEALGGLVRGLGQGTGRELNDASKKAVEGLITEVFVSGGENDDTLRVGAAKSFGAYCRYVSTDDAKPLIASQFSALTADVEWPRFHSVLLAIDHALIDSPPLVSDLGFTAEVVDAVCRGFEVDKSSVGEAAVSLASHLLTEPYLSEGVADKLIPALIGALPVGGKSSSDARREALNAIKSLAKTSHQTLVPFFPTLIPVLMACVRDRTIPVKLAAERCMVRVFKVKEGDQVVKEYCKSVDAPTGRTVGDYVRRVLSKLDADSEDEGEVQIFS